MPVYSNTSGKLKKLNLLPLDKEKALQKLVEENLLEVLDMRFLVSEYPTTHGGRIDTLAIDSDGAPVIIEYKRSRNDNVINQALSYLKWLKAQKVEFFERLVMKKLGAENLPKIDWNNPRIVCIAESYSKFDIDTLEVIPLRLELYKFHYYENDLFVLDKVNGEDEKLGAAQNFASEKVIIKTKEQIIPAHSKAIDADTEIILKSNLENQLKKGQQFVQDLYRQLESKIFELDENIYRKNNPQNIGFRISKAFAEVHIRKDHILIYLRPVVYDDPDNKVFKVPDTHGWALSRGVRIKNEEELHYIMPLIEMSYNDIL
ncbi:DUF5655 domain-containing protein [Mucilaginibacter dorajii]|uniref:DUF5655 domain-containing protein n=1 Tax=Mucilaginibacter dorajii TaxID=692994 RepID=A0ABP7PLJ3_9SPHI|nr:DUF5655 domain-containing protein [Mucilaginibacter dorajii]MCS3733632.1 putative transport protein [Mucilaginibacter dorajii]